MNEFLRDEGDGGGVGGDAGSEAPTDQGAGGLGGEAAAGESNDKGGKSKGETKDGTPTVEDLQKQVETLTGEKETLTGEKKTLAEKLGKSSKAVGLTRQLKDGFETNAQAMLESLAKEHGVKATFGEKAPDLAKTFESGDGSEQAGAIGKMLQQFEHRMDAKFGPKFRALHESDLAGKYKDFDDMTETRTVLGQQVATGTMSQDELLHHAARGVHIAPALKAAGEEAVAKYVADLDKKNSEQVAGSGGAEGENKGGKEQPDFKNIAGDLSRHNY